MLLKNIVDNVEEIKRLVVEARKNGDERPYKEIIESVIRRYRNDYGDS